MTYWINFYRDTQPSAWPITQDERGWSTLASAERYSEYVKTIGIQTMYRIKVTLKVPE